MVKIWTHCNSEHNRDLPGVQERGNAEWDHAHNFATFPQLHTWLGSLGVECQVSTLVINCHGQFGGQIYVDVVLDSTSPEARFMERFRPLQRFLAEGAHLWLTGCAMANGEEGTELLRILSRQLAGRVIIGFDRGSLNQGVEYAPGNILLQDLVPITDPSQAGQLQQRVHKFHPAAKWVRNEIVLRYPRDEQRLRPHQRCAYPLCRGHSEPTHQCDGGWNPGCQWRGTPRRKAYPGNPDFLYWAPGDHDPACQARSDRPRRGRVPAQGGSYRQPGPEGGHATA